MMDEKSDFIFGAISFIIVAITFLGSFAAWITHIYVAFTAGAWLLFIFGAVFFPVAVVHGVSSWFGFPWV